MSGRELSDRAAGSTLQSAAYSPDGTLLATAYAGGDVRISAGAGGRTRIDAHVPLRSVGQLEFSPDGLTIACGDLSGQGSKSARPALVLLNAQSGRRYRDGALGSPGNTPGRDPGAYRGFFRGLAETWNGRPFAVAAPTWRVLTWNHGITLGTSYGGAPDEQLTQTPAIACATAGDLVAALDTSGTIRLWDSASGNLLAKGYLGRSTVGGKLAFSHDGRFLACTCHDTITVWHVS
jgi:WD40 repeat protein